MNDTDEIAAAFEHLARQLRLREISSTIQEFSDCVDKWNAGQLDDDIMLQLTNEFSGKILPNIIAKYDGLDSRVAVAMAVAGNQLRESEIPPALMAIVEPAVKALRSLCTAPAVGSTAVNSQPLFPAPVLTGHTQDTTKAKDAGSQEFRCPSCSQLIYNRRLSNCEFCGKPIPSNLLYSAAEAERVAQNVQKEIDKQLQDLKAEKRPMQTGTGKLPHGL